MLNIMKVIAPASASDRSFPLAAITFQNLASALTVKFPFLKSGLGFMNPYSKEPAVFVLGEPLLHDHFNEKNPFEILGPSFKGTVLKGIRYEQLIPFVNPGEGAFRVITGDFVTTEDGTGIVHIAPTFGADDDKVGKLNGIPGMWMKDAYGVMKLVKVS